MEKIKVWFKKNWQIVLIVLLTMLFLNKCTTSCSRGQKIKAQTHTIEVCDSTITKYTDSIKYLNITIDNLETQLSSEKSHTSNFAGIATDNQKEMSNKNSLLTTENKNLQAKVKRLENENNKLIKELEAVKSK